MTDPHTGPVIRPPSPTVRRPVGPAILLTAGCALVVAGMFLPWLSSGSVDRNSFAVVAVLSRLNVVRNGALAWVPGLWPVAAVAMLVPVALLVLGLRRSAGGCAAVLGLFALVLGVLTLALGSGRAAAGIRLALTGPVVLAVGAAVMLVAAVLLLRRRQARSVQTDPQRG